VNEHWYNIAYGMLAPVSGGAPFKLNPDLEAELRRVDEMCRAEGGGLESRQAIAIVILDWGRRNHGHHGIEYL
jgi:hypothetical protein